MRNIIKMRRMRKKLQPQILDASTKIDASPYYFSFLKSPKTRPESTNQPKRDRTEPTLFGFV